MSEFSLHAGDVQDALQAAIELEMQSIDAVFTFGYPSGGPDVRAVWLKGDFDSEISRQSSGGLQRDEEATLTVRILVTSASNFVADVRNSALEIERAVERAVAADVTLDGTVREARIARARGDEGITEDGRRQFGIDVTVAYSVTVSRTA